MRARWMPLTIEGSWNREARRVFADNSGAYAIRYRATGAVLYVGESHTGRGWKTLTRHFQDASGKFAALRETFTHARPEMFEVAIWVTSRGRRTEEKRDRKAEVLEAALIRKFVREGHDLYNVDDKRSKLEALRVSGRTRRMGAPADPDADFDFGANVTREEERRAFDGVIANPPQAGAQAVPLKANPSKVAKPRRSRAAAAALVVLGDLVSIVHKPPTGRRRTLRWGARDAPIVAYAPSTGRLVLVFGAELAGKSSAPASKEYRRTHWGAAGAGERLEGQILGGTGKKLGPAIEITYATKKGADPALVNYWHKFGDHGDGSKARPFIPPAVVAATVKGLLLVRLDGGSYRVGEHGIVG